MMRTLLIVTAGRTGTDSQIEAPPGSPFEGLPIQRIKLDVGWDRLTHVTVEFTLDDDAVIEFVLNEGAKAESGIDHGAYGVAEEMT